MNKYIEHVKEFHQAFNHPINKIDSEIPLGLRQLRIKLLFEEIEELAIATDCKNTFSTLCMETAGKLAMSSVSDDGNFEPIEDGENRDKKEEIDALADIQYVLSGAILAYGYQDKFDEAFDEVQRSNMSKACSTREEALDTQQWYIERDGTESHIEEKGDKFIVLRTSDNKILKNKYYSPAELDKFTI